ncbi:MAG: hypothetical protein KIT16_21705, partial [Rhodospirillaceae bacterium]|nr:hypothetical protein [Rhodospirillaceae bacterium]
MARRKETPTQADSRNALPLPARSLGYHLRQLSESWSNLMKTMLDAHGLTEGQWRYLRELWGNEGLTQRELGERTGRQGPSTLAALRLL